LKANLAYFIKEKWIRKERAPKIKSYKVIKIIKISISFPFKIKDNNHNRAFIDLSLKLQINFLLF